MTAKTRVRNLGGGDVALFRRVLDLLGDAFEDPDTYHANQPDDDYIERLLAKDHFIALAAFDAEGRLTGALAAYELQKFEQARCKEGVIVEIAGEPGSAVLVDGFQTTVDPQAVTNEIDCALGGCREFRPVELP